MSNHPSRSTANGQGAERRSLKDLFVFNEPGQTIRGRVVALNHRDLAFSGCHTVTLTVNGAEVVVRGSATLLRQVEDALALDPRPDPEVVIKFLRTVPQPNGTVQRIFAVAAVPEASPFPNSPADSGRRTVRPCTPTNT
jgi:hypothetical protein